MCSLLCNAYLSNPSQLDAWLAAILPGQFHVMFIHVVFHRIVMVIPTIRISHTFRAAFASSTKFLHILTSLPARGIQEHPLAAALPLARKSCQTSLVATLVLMSAARPAPRRWSWLDCRDCCDNRRARTNEKKNQMT